MSLTKTLRNTVDLRSWVLLPWLDVGLTLFNLSLCRVEVGLMLPRRSAICWALNVWSWESSVSLEAEEGSTHSVTVLTTVPSKDDIYNINQQFICINLFTSSFLLKQRKHWNHCSWGTNWFHGSLIPKFISPQTIIFLMYFFIESTI